MPVQGLVSVICIAFNHEKWIEDTLISVIAQDYQQVELIIVDNGSSDLSSALIQKWKNGAQTKMPVKVFLKTKPEGYCALFNEMLEMVNGEFVIDLSGDDQLLPSHIRQSVSRLNEHSDAAFSFSDAWIVTEQGDKSTFYSRDKAGDLSSAVQDNWLYELLIWRNHICAPTVVFRTVLLRQEGGYDASLSYEDFDVQLRLSRKYPAVFSDHIGVVKQKHLASLSATQYQRYQSLMLPSTLQVCRKVQSMNQVASENSALRERVMYELKHALWSANFEVAEGFVHLGTELKISGAKFLIYKLWLWARLDLSALYVRLRG
ncbi:glycosyltransferase [Algoriphagus halophytocola]|uniref:Glycosyltransferase n=1 Tax=Algoriphagus halophytocola TaxID=2991499 RepID=A0ABY6ML83_9BACT|nr:glycosyltransferase [Algoriphagus sp. TR-M5]UZD24289.1 glycosyltransferase [Algoriphagus sp. TR-M5]